MATELLACRVCGKKYKGCRTAEQSNGVFRWQAVSCSPECGEIYLQRILESRKPVVAEKTKEDTEQVQKRQRRKIRKAEPAVDADVAEASAEVSIEMAAEPEE